MHSVRRYAWLAALAAGLVLGQGPASAADAGKGKDIYVKQGCWQCHGFVGQGGIAGPKIAPDPMPLEALVSFLRNSNRAMPPYSEAVLPTAEVADVHAYMASIPKPADYKTVPILAD
jgi:ubiquinol-cytochrome c reductase cytochrome c subunit